MKTCGAMDLKGIGLFHYEVIAVATGLLLAVLRSPRLWVKGTRGSRSRLLARFLVAILL